VIERSKSERIVVIGGGLTGLAAAHRLYTRSLETRRPIEILLFEAKSRLGGAIWTENRDGFLLEGGADSFITNKPWGVDLCRELGLSDQLIGTDQTRRRSFVVREGKLTPVPEGFVMMAPSRIWPLLFSPILSWKGKLRLLLERFVPRKSDDSDESLAAFVKRRLGRETLDRLVQPLVGGIYTADPNDLSLAATLPQFAAMERDHGSLTRAARRQKREDKLESGARYGLFASLKDGMGTLPTAIEASLPNGVVRLNTPIRRVIRPDAAGPWRIETLDGHSYDASAVLLATEAHASARLVDVFDPELAAQLRSIPYASSIVANVAYSRDAIAHPLDGFGVVVPAIENRSILAVSFTSVKFAGRAPADSVLLRVFVGGATQPELFELDDAAIHSLIEKELTELLGVTGSPRFIELARHSRGMPQYTLGHIERVAAIRVRQATHLGLGLAGNAFQGVGIPDCIRSGQEAADALLASLAEAAKKAVA
jgi:oxygen-dependent protoporphyrinogen oxidase